MRPILGRTAVPAPVIFSRDRPIDFFAPGPKGTAPFRSVDNNLSSERKGAALILAPISG